MLNIILEKFNMILYVQVQPGVLKEKLLEILTEAKVNQSFCCINHVISIDSFLRNLVDQQKRFDMLLKMIILEKKQVSFIDCYSNFVFI